MLTAVLSLLLHCPPLRGDLASCDLLLPAELGFSDPLVAQLRLFQESQLSFLQVTSLEANGNVVQCISDLSDSWLPPEGDTEYLSLVDVNDDSLPDLLLLTAWGVTGNQTYRVWLFDPYSRRFVHSPAFTDILFMVKGFSLGPILVTWAGDLRHRSDRTYQTCFEQPILVGSRESDYIEDTDDSWSVRTFFYLPDGTPVLESERFSDEGPGLD